jgi:hypothetical protein
MPNLEALLGALDEVNVRHGVNIPSPGELAREECFHGEAPTAPCRFRGTKDSEPTSS